MADQGARIVFHLGGPAGHPVAEQARAAAGWLGDRFAYDFIEGAAAFDALGGCDLLVLMGMHWTGSSTNAWAGNRPYEPLGDRQQAAFEGYVASGRPLLVHHGAIASYDDWPRFGELRGLSWVWGETDHPPFATFPVRVLPTGHPVVAGVEDFQIDDELYYNVRVAPGIAVAAHAVATHGGVDHPMVLTAEGGRAEGAGRLVYLANGHDMRAFASPALRRLWQNSVGWLLSRDGMTR
jgi:type 1 glutamine amidotransferase